MSELYLNPELGNLPRPKIDWLTDGKNDSLIPVLSPRSLLEFGAAYGQATNGPKSLHARTFTRAISGEPVRDTNRTLRNYIVTQRKVLRDSDGVLFDAGAFASPRADRLTDFVEELNNKTIVFTGFGTKFISFVETLATTIDPADLVPLAGTVAPLSFGEHQFVNAI